MRKVLSVLIVVLLPPIISLSAGAQELSPQLTKFVVALECIRKIRMPGWSLERVPPFSGDGSVLIVGWGSGGRRVTASIQHHQSEALAIESMRHFLSTEKVKRIQGLGDEAYSWGYSDAIILRRGNITVSVSAISDIDRLLPMLDDTERAALRRTEEIALNKNFAGVMSAVLANPSSACGPIQRF